MCQSDDFAQPYEHLAPRPTHDGLGRQIVHLREGSGEALVADIHRMIQLSREHSAALGVPLHCFFTLQRKLVCEVKPNAVTGFGELVDSPHFFQNDCGVTFLPTGLPVGCEPVKLYQTMFLPGQFKQLCERILREEGFLPRL